MNKNPDLCTTCQVAAPAGLIGRTYYANCLDCVEKNSAKREQNRRARLQAKHAAIKAKA